MYYAVVFCFQNVLKLTYEHLQFLKFFRGYTPGPPLKGEGKGFGREGETGIGGEGMEMRKGGRNKGKGKEEERDGRV